jgi:hypothetical protein
MPRQRLYPSNADRQAAYRARLASRQADATKSTLAARVEELEASLLAMTARAQTADRRAAEAEDQAAIAFEQVKALKITIAALQHRPEAAASGTEPAPSKGLNREARRQAERDARRRRH